MHHQSLATAVLNYQQAFDSYFVKVSTSSNSLCAAFGVERRWHQSELGSYKKNTQKFNIEEVVKNNSDLKISNCEQLTENILAHNLISNGIQHSKRTCFATVYSPLYHLNSLLGGHLDYQQILLPENQAMLDLLTSLTIEYIVQLQETENVSIYYCCFYCTEQFCSYSEFTRDVANCDLNCIEAIKGLGNLLHYHCQGNIYYDFLLTGKFSYLSIEQCFDLQHISTLQNTFKEITFVGLLDPILSLTNNLESSITEYICKLSYALDRERLIMAPSCTLPLSVTEDKIAEILRLLRTV